MNESIIDTVDQFITEVDENIYLLDFNSFRSLRIADMSLREKVILAKEEFISSEKNLDIDDLYMVRSMDKLPESLSYKSYSNSGGYQTMSNPFSSLLPMMMDREVLDIVCPCHRDTIHFTINGLVSNLWFTNGFTNRGIVSIEALINHLNYKLVNLNPIDTMIDVGKEEEQIKENAIFIFSKKEYDDLSEDMKESISSHKIYLFDSDKLSASEEDIQRSYPLLEMITDFVLCHNGILPQHSINQTILREEDFSDGDWIDGKYISNSHSDKDYLKRFTDLIDKISLEQFGISYYNLSDEIKANREVNKDRPGVSHYDTKYWNEEIINNNRLRKETFDRYLDFLEQRVKLPSDILDDIHDKYYKYIDSEFNENNYGGIVYSAPPGLSFNQENEIKKIVSYDKMIELTNEFNDMEIDRIKNNCKQNEINNMIEDNSLVSNKNKSL
jgi:hypothetical protein